MEILWYPETQGQAAGRTFYSAGAAPELCIDKELLTQEQTGMASFPVWTPHLSTARGPGTVHTPQHCTRLIWSLSDEKPQDYSFPSIKHL